MLKKTITYTDYNGLERTEDFYFNLSKAELVKMELGTAGGLIVAMNKIVNEKQAPSLIQMFEDLVLGAYGEKSPDGKYFTKNDEVREKFKCTEAYSNLFMELSQDAEATADFIKGIIPSDLADEVSKQQPTLMASKN